eukprot:7169634-Pyramimonas_sp.AAC.1
MAKRNMAADAQDGQKIAETASGKGIRQALGQKTRPKEARTTEPITDKELYAKAKTGNLAILFRYRRLRFLKAIITSGPLILRRALD